MWHTERVGASLESSASTPLKVTLRESHVTNHTFAACLTYPT